MQKYSLARLHIASIIEVMKYTIIKFKMYVENKWCFRFVYSAHGLRTVTKWPPEMDISHNGIQRPLPNLSLIQIYGSTAAVTLITDLNAFVVMETLLLPPCPRLRGFPRLRARTSCRFSAFLLNPVPYFPPGFLLFPVKRTPSPRGAAGFAAKREPGRTRRYRK